MPSPTQLQFRLMAPEAQRAAVQRLMLLGATPAQIAEWTGVAPQDLSRAALPASLSTDHARRGIKRYNSRPLR